MYLLEVKCLIISLIFANFIQREALILFTSLLRRWGNYVNGVYHSRNIHLKTECFTQSQSTFLTWYCTHLTLK